MRHYSKQKLLFFCALPFLLVSPCLLVPAQTASPALRAAQWQEDLRFLQKTVHEQYSFLFKKVSAVEFDEQVDEFHSNIPSMQPHEIKVGLSRIVSLFKYGHTQIPFDTVAGNAVLPVNWYHFEDGIFVEGVHRDHKDALGAKLLKVGDTPVEEALKLIRPVVPAENDQYFKWLGLRFLTAPSVLHAQRVIPNHSNEVTFTLEKDGKVFEHTFSTVPLAAVSTEYGFTKPSDEWLSARVQDETPLFLKYLNEKLYYFEYLEDSKTLYVRQSSVFDDEKERLADFYKRLFRFIDNHEIEKLVYDVRLNGGGDNSNNIPLIKGIMARPKINKRGTLFYVIGRHTFSACQNLTNEIEKYTEAVIVGEPTSENENFYGDARKVTLPNSKINAYLSFAWWQDKPQWENRDWTAPHIAKAMTFKQYASNQDVVLDAALNFSDAGYILDPMQHLKELFMAGKFEELRTATPRIVNDPAYKYYDFDKEFRSAGNHLLSSGNAQGGAFVLQSAADLFPGSADTQFSLASALEQLKQFQKAKDAYRRVITIAPDSAVAKSAKGKLEALNMR